MTKTITQNYTTVAALKAAITAARQDAKAEAIRDCGKGCITSRGAWIKTLDAKGNILKGECDSWPFEGNKAELEFLANLLRYDTNVAEIVIEGGWDWAANPRAQADGEYDPWVSEWTVSFGTVELAPDEVPPESLVPVVEAAAAAPAAATFDGPSIEETIAQLRAACVRREQEVAELPADAWVILWGAHAIRTNGAQASLLGHQVYHGSRWLMERDAERFAASAAASVTPSDPVRALSRDEALAEIRTADAILLASLPKVAA